jgi:hypothetical protein
MVPIAITAASVGTAGFITLVLTGNSIAAGSLGVAAFIIVGAITQHLLRNGE